MIAIGRGFIFTIPSGHYGIALYHLANPFLADSDIPMPQLPPNPRPTVGAAGLGMDRLDVGEQGHIMDPATLPVR